MVLHTMGGRWTSCFTLLILVVGVHGCSSLNSEGTALLHFRAKVEFDPSGALSNWNADDCDPCMWSGVECLDGQVVMLNLSGLYLEGVLAPELGNLAHLKFLDLSKNHLFGTIPPQFGQLRALEVLDLRDNSLSGTVPSELGELHSLKRLLLRSNRFEGRIPVEIEKLCMLTDLQFDNISTSAAPAEIGCVNRKFGHCIWQGQSRKAERSIIHYLKLLAQLKFPSDMSHNHGDNDCSNLTDSPDTGVIRNVDMHVTNVRRILDEQTSSNLVAVPPNIPVPPPTGAFVSLPSRSSGSFPAIPNAKKLSPLPIPSPTSGEENMPRGSRSNDNQSSAAGNSVNSLKLIIGILAAVFLLIVLAVIFAIFRCRAAKTIGPWKTGLSGQLQKAFITGVPKLNRGELETACEDFSNIIYTHDGVATLYKGTLSSGVEIAVVSTAIGFLNEWSKRAELTFRKKIDSLSRVNHKNYVNLIGYCSEDVPFTRMMVFEYAPNGSLFEHLHIKELEHLDWSARMRIIMGTAYCLQYMHDLTPPIAHVNLTSKDIFLTDDYAAKIADVSFWAELIAKSKNPSETDSEHSDVPLETNVRSFGILLIEIISGKLACVEGQGKLVNWAAQYLNDKATIKNLIDPSLASFKENELETVCDVIQSCIEEDWRKRPPMKEVIPKLRQAIDISAEAATPRLSPLWWAELEILSAEAA
ncbi:hypothetical protein ABFS82_13G095800 [Erythranthe guttata]|uniref:probable LRR receptor-like serine/threonine-protein kinase MRH1 n=1 Tax=Erythranthe guttata TaxID=4155 RepID=UPI00064E0264|nr:PREDICTED: probable LRR receptor-like serine/threonine-protein kinase MRH1 [Erythranthe guttata]XP_012849108.1 PREDICTED: probable LRR receptor-like serine/threonine-protein kinase MRH1 [Erythranthe guttata]|eukprot:XP_012849107.1 PREDICTED: probable LRR receptor-like serine/threonine-protein kinase MRH1 [Erythranthe guttata]